MDAKRQSVIFSQDEKIVILDDISSLSSSVLCVTLIYKLKSRIIKFHCIVMSIKSSFSFDT